MARSKDSQFSPEQEAFLAKARRIAYQDELHPNHYGFLRASRRLMKEAVSNGITVIDPLLLGNHYKIGREAARRRRKKAS